MTHESRLYIPCLYKSCCCGTLQVTIVGVSKLYSRVRFAQFWDIAVDMVVLQHDRPLHLLEELVVQPVNLYAHSRIV